MPLLKFRCVFKAVCNQGEKEEQGNSMAQEITEQMGRGTEHLQLLPSLDEDPSPHAFSTCLLCDHAFTSGDSPCVS